MKMNEIIFNNKGNYTDFDTILNYFKPQPPTPKIIKDSVPYMNGYYDFSNLGSNGEPVFDERKINCSIQFDNNNKASLMQKYTELLEWLLCGIHDLIYTGESDIQYIARVEEVPSFDYFCALGGEFIFNFQADPFKYLLDNPMITITQAQSIYNPYIYCNPSVRVYGSGNLILNGESIAVTGTYTDINYLTLKNGQNTISFDGSITKIEITPNWRRL